MQTSPVGSVLVVDDDEGFRVSLAKVLEREGYRVSVLATADEVTETLARSPVDVMVIDYSLPHTDGLTVARDSIRRIPGLKVILITPFGDGTDQPEEDVDKAIIRASKPLRRDDVIEMIRAVS